MNAVLSAPGHVVIQAGTGYGKSVLLDQVATRADQAVWFEPASTADSEDRFDLRLRAAYEQAGVFDLAASLLGDPPRGGRHPTAPVRPPTLLLVDDVDRLDEVGVRRLTEHVRRARGLVRLVAAGRRIATTLRRLELSGEVLHLGHDEMSVGLAELDAFVGDRLPGVAISDTLLRRAIDTSAGCFTVLQALVQRASTSSDPSDALAQLVERNTVLPALVEQCTDDLGPADLATARFLARVPEFPAALVDQLGGCGTLDRLVAAGIPLWADGGAWLSLPRPVAELLATSGRPDALRVRVAATSMIGAGRPRVALELLLSCGLRADAAAMLDAPAASSLGALHPIDILTATERLGEVLEQHPGLMIQRADAFWAIALLGECRQELDRAEWIAVRTGNDVVARQAQAEVLLLDSLHGPTADVLERMTTLAERLGPDELIAHARLNEARGAVAAWRQEQQGLAAAELHFRRAAALWAQIGQPEKRARALRGLVVAVLLPAGRYDDALRALRTAVAISDGGGVSSRTATVALLAQVAAANGDADVAAPAIAEARSLGRATGMHWVEAYAAWADMLLASQRHDAGATSMYHAEATSLLGELADHSTGAILLGEAVVAASRAGDPDHARAHLAALEELPGTAGDRALARLTVLAHDDPLAAIAFAEELAASGKIPAGRRWQSSLMHALALGRAGRLDEAEQLYRLALRRAGDWGVAHLPAALDAPACATLERLVNGDDNVTYLTAGAGEFSVRVLGTFEVWRHGRLVPMAASNATELVKLVAAHGGRVSVELACDALWPESTSDAGRKRLKNVMLRARVATAGLVERQDQAIVLQPGTLLDLSDFDRLARAATATLRDDAPGARQLARSALEIAGTLLPADLYAEWSTEPRLLVCRRIAALVDLVLTEPVDAAGAAWLAELVTTADPYDDGRLLRIAALLNENGGEALATALISQVGETYGQLGHVGA